MPDELVSIAISPAAFRAAQRAASGKSNGDLNGDGSFLAGPENRLAAAAARTLLEPPSPYNPLVVCGVPGSGKSHLAQGLAARFDALGEATANGSRAVCLTGADFARELADAIELETVGTLRARWSAATLFVLEDLTQLATKRAAQAELVVLLDLFARQGTQVIVTSRLPPAKIPELSPPLASRLSAGLLVPLVLPGTAARCALIEQFAAGREIAIEPAAARQLADGLNGNVPELYGAVLELSLLAREDAEGDTASAIESPLVRRYLLDRSNRLRPTLRQIVRHTARFFGLKSADLKSSSRRRAVVTARGVVIYLARQLTGQSLQQLGTQLGGRDHSTVLHSFRQTEERLRTDPEIQRAIGEIGIALAGG